MDPTKGDAKNEEHLIKPPSEKERISPSTSSDDDDDGDSPEDLFQLDINKSPAASGQELRLQSGAQTNPFSSLIDDDVITTTPDRPRSETDVPDLDRIPSSIFIRTSSNSPTQWSAASNESLFSIQGGNSSFSKDNASLSGRYDGLSPGPPSAQPPPSLGSINAATVEVRREELEEAANAKAIKDAVLQAHNSEGQRQSEEQRLRSSDGSTKSFQSFAFPILTGEGRNSSAKAESAHPLRPANKPQQQPQPETQLPKSSSASPPAAAAAASPPPPPPAAAASAPKSKWLACCRCPSFC